MATDRDSDALSGDVRRFTDWLERSGLPCFMLRHTDDCAELRFNGPLEGREVVWCCTFVTLAAERERIRREGGRVDGLRNFIEIGEPGPSGVPLRVGLAVARIDRASIDKMMLMIRLYKNLRPGRHEYGEPFRA